MMSKANQFRTYLVAGVACLSLLASCSTDEDDGTTLPDGKYPMTFTAQVDGLTATRATTDTDGKTSWQAGDPVAISMDGGANHKQYKISNTGTDAMSPDGEANILYWSKTQETLAAWYPIGCTIGSGGGGSEVSITDQSSSFGTLENILHAPAKGYTYSSGNPVAFTFRHALAKVKVTLQKGDGMENSDLSGATVTFMGSTAGTLGYGGMTGSGSNGSITPKTVTSTTNGNSITTYTALLIPQQMQGEKFIKVTVGTSNAARDYYYTPTGSTDANLEAGKEYAYTITVKKTGLTVQVTDNGAAWGSGTDITGSTPSTIEHHVITITNNSSLNDLVVKDANGTAITAQHDGTYQLPATATTFSVSYSPSDKTKSLVPTSGLCRLSSRSANTDNGLKYICNYSSVISDVTLDLDKYVQAGDYYYSDGTWTPETPSASSDGSPTAIGVVFYAGAGPDDDISHYSGSGLTGKIHGYAVAAKDLLDGAKTSYGGKLPKVSDRLQDYDVPEIANNNNSSYNGYSVTKIIKESYISQTTTYEFPAFAACATYHSNVQAAPNNSSGWYLPSAAMLGAINGIKNSPKNCPGGSVLKNSWGTDYMSCSESGAGTVQGYSFYSSGYTGRTKNDDATYARAVLTF